MAPLSRASSDSIKPRGLFIYFLILQVRLTLGFCFLSWNNLSSSVFIWFNYWKLSHTHNLSCLYQDHKRAKFQSLLLILGIGLIICLWFQFKEKVYYYDLNFFFFLCGNSHIIAVVFHIVFYFILFFIIIGIQMFVLLVLHVHQWVDYLVPFHRCQLPSLGL